MVVPTTNEAKRTFAKRLHEALDDVAGCPKSTDDGGRGRAAWVARRYSITGEGASKWLDGRVMPSQANFARIAADLNVTPFWLQVGQLPKRPAEDPTMAGLHDIWGDLDATGRLEVLRFAQFRASRQAEPPQDDNPA